MKILIAIPTCLKEREREQACMDTWFQYIKKMINVSPTFFTGPGEPKRTLVERVEANGNALNDLPSIIKGICKYAIAHNYDWILKVDTDTFVWVDRILKSSFEKFDYTGWTQPQFPDSENYASGGAGYWLSAKAMAIVAAAKLTSDTAEDRWVGRVLYDGGVTVHRDERYAHGDHREPFKDKSLVTFHPASPKRMRELFGNG